MRQPPQPLLALIRAIVSGDDEGVSALLATSPDLAVAAMQHGATRQDAAPWYLPEINHYVYAGDTALHIAAGAYRPAIVRSLLAAGADVDARNRHGAQPLHYAADGAPGSPAWDPEAQADTITTLVAGGADPNAADRRGVTPLHRAVRTRCSAGVRALLDAGADGQRPNGSGTTPMQLANRATGRGGSGSPQARAERDEIVRLLRRHGAGEA